MKTLRVLTGLHAGAQMPLAPGRYRIARAPAGEAVPGGDSAATGISGAIELFDWTTAPCELEVPAAGQRVRLIVSPAASAADTPATARAVTSAGDPWPDLLARRFGDVVLCVGESDTAWPTDAELLLRLRLQAPAHAAPVSRPRSSWWPRAGVLGAGLLVAGSALYGRVDVPRKPPPPPSPAMSAEMLGQALAVRGLAELKVSTRRNDVVVTGLVRDAQEGALVQEAVAELQRTPGVRVVDEWAVADSLASTIEGALRQKEVRVRYVGEGQFVIEGSVAKPEAAKLALIQIKADLGSNVRELLFDLKPLVPLAPTTTAVSAGDVSYSERSDGAKSFSFGRNLQ